MVCSHFSHRLKNRSIDKQWINLLVNLGTAKHDNQGAVSYHFDRKAIKRLLHAKGFAFVQEHLSYLRKLYLVERVNDDRLVTIAYKTKRLKR